MSDSINSYLNAIGRISLLRPDQEIMLGKRVQAWIALRDQSSHTREERRVMRVGLRARDAMVNANLRLVVDIAKKYVRRSESSTLLDLVGMGNEGLICGVERFDPTRGYRLTTFCYWWIRQGIVRGLHNADNMIRLPSHMHEQMGKVAQVISSANSPMSLADAVKIANVKSDYIQSAYVAKGVTSLDKMIDGDRSIIECIADDSHQGEHFTYELGIDVRQLLGVLNDNERFVLLGRYSMAGDDVPWTLQALGKSLGVSRERARQLEQRAIRKMRYAAEAHLNQKAA